MRAALRCLKPYHAAAPLRRLPSLRLRYSTLPTSSTDNTVRLRFGPSPTGFLHLGGLRTALFNYLAAKSRNGKFILRIEDTDQSRLVPGAQQALIDTLKAVDVTFDEGPETGGPVGPYIQSQRLPVYRQHAEKLIKTGQAYPCFCTQERLESVKQKFREARQLQSYDKHCATIPQEEAQQMREAGKPHVIRFSNIPGRQASSFKDLVYGQVGSATIKVACEDFILVKSDGYPTYHFANVVDDHCMGISLVMRGEEWLPSTPKHLALYKAFKWHLPPQFAHMPLLVSPSGQKLSKRDGDVHVEHYLTQGWEPEALVNYVALMSASWEHATREDGTLIEDQVMTITDLVRNFSLDHLNRHRSSMFAGKLAYLNRKHLERKSATPDGLVQVVERLHQSLVDAHPTRLETLQDRTFLQRIFFLLQDRIDKITDYAGLPEMTFILNRPDYSSEAALKVYDKIDADDYVVSVQMTADSLVKLAELPSSDEIKAVLGEVKQSSGLTGKHLMTPLRHALTGCKSGPDVPSLIATLGIPETVGRLNSALEFWNGQKPGQREQDKDGHLTGM